MATEEAVGSAVYDLRHLLPGLPTGKLCFQELLAVERALDAGADLEDTNELRLEKRRRDKNALASTDGGPASGLEPRRFVAHEGRSSIFFRSHVQL